jgi:hypothetical protein
MKKNVTYVNIEAKVKRRAAGLPYLFIHGPLAACCSPPLRASVVLATDVVGAADCTYLLFTGVATS